ncbi:MAG: caspase family protein [Saprospiraceae bacterium]|nr:caspase family protein [Saprospiraceae bacterium]
MKTLFTTLLGSLIAFSLFSQTEKGLTPSSKKNTSSTGVTYAVVIGISDYQDVGIPDLNFADKDAEAFAEWLKSSAGGSVPDSNIIFLTNEKATNARIAASLDWLIEVAGEGEQVVIYFSGHGDVETKTRGQFGFLLAWDSPPTNYKAGAYSIIYLQDIISTLSIDKKARVTVVTDACHAGKLAGSSIGGTQATAQALSQQFASEVKIMSCQPNEFSLEGQQWGNGRGVFSYHLLDGLSGLADENGDGTIALREIGRYLEDEVPAEAAPHQQTPLIVGDRNALLAKVDAATLAVVQGKKKTAPLAISNTGSKGLADGYLASADSMTQAMYHAFEAALAAGHLLDGDSSADFFYQKLLGKAELKPLHGLMRRNLAVALQDEVQQALNACWRMTHTRRTSFCTTRRSMRSIPATCGAPLNCLGAALYVPGTAVEGAFFESYNLHSHSMQKISPWLFRTAYVRLRSRNCGKRWIWTAHRVIFIMHTQ